VTIEQELVACLEAATPAGRRKTRDIAIVLHLYGFAGVPWPTLEDTAAAFRIGTRERVRQIRNSALGVLAGPARLPSLRRAAQLIRSKPFWRARGLTAKIAQTTRDSPDLGLRGLLALMHELGLVADYEAHDPSLERLTRPQLALGGEYVLVRADALAGLKGDLREAHALSAQRGLANTADLALRLGSEAPIERGCVKTRDL
jgi:hypothetical protein